MRPTFLPLLSLLALAACDGADTDGVLDTDDTDGTDASFEPGIVWNDLLLAVDVTPDGRTALFQDAATLTGELHLVDVATGASEVVTELGDVTLDLATGLSSGRAISALHGVPVQAGLWTEADGWLDLPSPYVDGCDPQVGGAFDVSDGGDVVVGLMWDGCSPAAFRWTRDGGVAALQRLGEAPEGSLSPPTNRATAVSGDGTVAAGFAAYGVLDRSPARWDVGSGAGALLDPDEHDLPGEVFALDLDGDTLAGQSGADGWVWTEAGGFVDVPRTDGALPSEPVFPNALTADGALVFGAVGSEFFSIPTAFVWSASQGTRALAPLVEAADVVLEEGWSLTSVMAVSDDGSVLVGRGLDPEGASKGFVLRVPVGTWD